MSSPSNEFAHNDAQPPMRPYAPRAPGVVEFGASRDTGAPGDEKQHLDVEEVLRSVCETVYRWDFETDEMRWAEGAPTVLQVAEFSGLARGRAFSLLVDPEHAGTRYDAITGGPYVGPDVEIRYHIHYRFLPEGRRGQRMLWIEDTGVCRTGVDCRPRFAQGTLRVVDDRRRQEERLVFLSNHDELTGQLNRTRLTEELTAILSSPGQGAQKGGFLLAAVNDLTLINETYGFDIGDEVIAIIGRRLGRVVRGRDCIGRFSSNKFGIVLPDCTIEGMQAIAQRLMVSVREHVLDTSVGAVATSLSVGGVLLPQQAASAQTAIGRALEALETARTRPSEHFALYQPCERRESERRRGVAIADEIVRALNDRRLILALQPIVTARSREPELYECLLRLRRLDGTVLAAADFIPIAEQYGLARLVDHRVLELAVELLRASPDLKLALNISATTTTDAGWIASLEAFTGKSRALTERLTVEITETAAIADIGQTADFVTALKALGCRVALDDFGAGYTSFKSLRRLGVDMVKIDGSFVEHLGSEAEDELFVRTLIDLAQKFGIDTVCEWVTDEKTAKMLEKAGAGYMQGFLFGRPELAEDEQTEQTAENEQTAVPK